MNDAASFFGITHCLTKGCSSTFFTRHSEHGIVTGDSCCKSGAVLDG